MPRVIGTFVLQVFKRLSVCIYSAGNSASSFMKFEVFVVVKFMAWSSDYMASKPRRPQYEQFFIVLLLMSTFCPTEL
jgi:hypothetical protein